MTVVFLDKIGDRYWVIVDGQRIEEFATTSEAMDYALGVMQREDRTEPS